VTTTPKPPVPARLEKPTVYTAADLQHESLSELHREQGELNAVRDTIMIYLHSIHKSQDTLDHALESSLETMDLEFSVPW